MNSRWFLVALFLLIASPALATGDHNGGQDARFICASKDAAVYLLNEEYTGGGTGGKVTWFWLRVDVKTGKQRKFAFGEHFRSADDEARIVFSGQVLDAGKIQDVFKGLKSPCMVIPDRFLTPLARWLRSSLVAGTVTLEASHPLLGDKRFQRSMRASWGEGFPTIEEMDSMSLSHEVRLGDRSILQFDGGSLTYDPVFFASVDADALDSARSSLLNEVGLELHRAGHHWDAIDWFKAAWGINGNQTAAYNVACAWARLGRADYAVSQLRALKSPQGLAAKIARDRDFDSIRKSPELAAFLQELNPSDAGR